MKESNKYHKFSGEGQKRNGLGFEDLKFSIKFNYVDEENIAVVKFMFKGYDFTASSTRLITEQHTGLVVDDRVFIDGSPGLITKIITSEKQKLSGQRFRNRKKVYLIEIEV